MNGTYLSDTQVAARFSVSRATVWRWIRNTKFPPPVKLSPGCTRWRLTDIGAWEAELSNGPTGKKENALERGPGTLISNKEVRR